MIFDLRTLDDDSGHFTGEHGIRIEDASGEEVAVRCFVKIDYQRTGAASYLKVALSGDYAASCYRCLEPVVVPVTGDFQAVIRHRGQHDREDDALDGSDYIVIAMGQHAVDLGPRIHENFVVNVPMLIVCHDVCKGLCPTCGTNLNDKKCACSASADSRWDALRDVGGSQREE